METKLNTMSKKDLLVISLLADIYVEKYGEEFDYDTVDKYYAYLGYELYAEQLLRELNIEGTSDLQEAMVHALEFL